MTLSATYDPQHPLGMIFAQLDESPSVAAYADAARRLDEHCSLLRPVTLALLASYTAQPMVAPLKVEAARLGFALDVQLGRFNAVAQDLLDPQGASAAHQADIVVAARLLEDVAPALAHEFLTLSPAEIDNHIADVVAEIHAQLAAFRQRSVAPVVVHNFTLPRVPALGRHEPMAADSQTDVIRRLNRELVQAVTGVSDCWVLDFDRVCADVGYQNWRDAKWWHLARQPLSSAVLPRLAAEHAGMINAVLGVPRKCLVLDLDHTLWSGVIGEDGLGGIQLGHSAPGSLFVEFQRSLKQLQSRGILLAINSKNNSADVDDVFHSHPDMILSRDDIAASRVNWESKPANMRAIATELNIGTDSLVFVDDNPVECAQMRQELPEVLTLQVPVEGGITNPTRLIPTLLGSGIFDKMSFNQEDRLRAEMYRAQSKRSQLRQTTASIEEFLESLEMTVEIEPVTPLTLPRLVDLVRKTNQLNIAPRRYSIGELAERDADPQTDIFSVRVTDRFGDNGIVGCLILRDLGKRTHIDTFLLSCRVIGRNIETAMLAHAADWAAAHDNCLLTANFLPTNKNAPTADLFSRHGFSSVRPYPESGDFEHLVEAAGPISGWQLAVDDRQLEWPAYLHGAASVLT